jgi:hypothetical protein
VLYVSESLNDFPNRTEPDLSLDHINNYMHPQAMIIDASGLEEDYFLASMRKQAPDSGIPLIELPENSITQLAWISKLDSSSLAGTDGYRRDMAY